MLTVFGHFEEGGSPEPLCVSVVFNAGPGSPPHFLGGQVAYTLCDGTSVGPITFGPSQTHVPEDCVINNSWQMTSTVTVSLNSVNEPCGGSSNPDNVFIVERQSDGFTTYAQLNSNYSVNGQARLSNDALQCYDITGTDYVGNPTIYDTLSSACSSGGGGPKGGGGNFGGPI